MTQKRMYDLVRLRNRSVAANKLHVGGRRGEDGEAEQRRKTHFSPAHGPTTGAASSRHDNVPPGRRPRRSPCFAPSLPKALNPKMLACRIGYATCVAHRGRGATGRHDALACEAKKKPMAEVEGGAGHGGGGRGGSDSPPPTHHIVGAHKQDPPNAPPKLLGSNEARFIERGRPALAAVVREGDIIARRRL